MNKVKLTAQEETNQFLFDQLRWINSTLHDKLGECPMDWKDEDKFKELQAAVRAEVKEMV